ncbi:hypothetical protein ACS0TY_025431 [Phlomoides rotata]
MRLYDCEMETREDILEGVSRVVTNNNEKISEALVGMDPTLQVQIDQAMIDLDKTDKKGEVGAHAILAVSMAACRAGAAEKEVPLYKHIAGKLNYHLPVLGITLITGGKHAGNNLAIQVLNFGGSKCFMDRSICGYLLKAKASMMMRKGEEKLSREFGIENAYYIGPDQIEALYQYAKFQFECGNYSVVTYYLYEYRTLCTNSERSLSALWVKLVTEILMQNWDIALKELDCLKEIIDTKNFSSLMNRVQIMHSHGVTLCIRMSHTYRNWDGTVHRPPIQVQKCDPTEEFLYGVLIVPHLSKILLGVVVDGVEGELVSLSNPVTEALTTTFAAWLDIKNQMHLDERVSIC